MKMNIRILLSIQRSVQVTMMIIRMIIGGLSMTMYLKITKKRHEVMRTLGRALQDHVASILEAKIIRLQKTSTEIEIQDFRRGDRALQTEVSISGLGILTNTKRRRGDWTIGGGVPRNRSDLKHMIIETKGKKGAVVDVRLVEALH